MKVRMITSMAGGFTLAYGDLVDLPPAVAEAWIESGIAVRAAPDEPAAVEEATAPAAPERATARRRKVK